MWQLIGAVHFAADQLSDHDSSGLIDFYKIIVIHMSNINERNGMHYLSVGPTVFEFLGSISIESTKNLAPYDI